MLIATHLSLGYGRTVLLEDVSLTLEPGTVTGLVAPNGFGKTTLLRALAGIDGARARGALDVDGTGPRDGSALRRLVFYAPATLRSSTLTLRRATTCAWRRGCGQAHSTQTSSPGAPARTRLRTSASARSRRA